MQPAHINTNAATSNIDETFESINDKNISKSIEKSLGCYLLYANTHIHILKAYRSRDKRT